MTREIAGLAGRGDSENETFEAAADTDTDSIERLHKHTQGGSFKRPAPVMGNRSLETRNSKRAQYNAQSQTKKEQNVAVSLNNSGAPIVNAQVPPPPITVGALEVQNVKRAINRYGTLPKGARIGAYLESLRQTSDNGPVVVNPRQAQKDVLGSNGPLIELPPPPPTLSAANHNSNSNSAMSPRAVVKSQPQMIRSNSSGGVTMTNSATQSLNKLQRHRTATDGSMITFSSFRGTSGSPKRSFNPTLADLEFPPPPSDLPPPPEEFESSADIDTGSSRSNLDTMQLSQSVSLAPSNDVSNTEPSVEEASSRFGVSLRKRETSTDSCSSLGSPAAAVTTEIISELKHVHEVNERAENQQKKLANDVPNNNNNNSNSTKADNKSADHISQLVNELAESMNLPKVCPTDIAKKNLSTAKTDINGVSNANSTNFKAQLKKVDPKKIYHSTAKDESNAIIDFKSRLRRVENNNEHDTLETNLEHKKITENDTDLDRSNSINKNTKNMKKTDIKVEIDDEKTKRDGIDAKATVTPEDEDKRKSTGSISSLKKLWEAKEGVGCVGLEQNATIQLSPKLASKSVISNNNRNGTEDEYDEHSSLANKKPAVPTKPTKLVSIYATPIQVKLNADGVSANVSSTTPTSSSSSTVNIATNNCNITMNSTIQVSREGILELIQLLEGSLKIPINSISASQWLQLSDKLNILQNSCVTFADKATMAPHSKFQFRELVTRVENQSRSLRSAGSKNIQDNEKLVSEVGQSLKQISNALHR